MDSSKRKQYRSLLNTIREACVYGRPLLLSDGYVRVPAVPIELRESGFRTLEETRTLIFRVPPEFPFSHVSAQLSLQIEQLDGVLSIPFTPIPADDNSHLPGTFVVSQASSSNRRASSRELAKEAFYVPILLYPKNIAHLPVSGFARIIDFDNKAVSFEIKIRLAIPEADFLLATVFFQDSTFFDGLNKLRIDQVRAYQRDHQSGYSMTSITAVSILPSSEEIREEALRLIQPKEPFKVQFRPYVEEASSLQVVVHQLIRNGLIGQVPPQQAATLPRVFLVEHAETKIRFKATKVGDSLLFKIASKALGQRTQWLNFVTHECLKYEYRFQPKDVRELTRLMLEAGAYSLRAISDLTLLEGYLQYKWPIEQSLPRTKYRWLVRDDKGKVIGHTAGVRVSECLWAAIDNIGSQNYQGSWNRDFVARWLRTFAELLRGHDSHPLIIWTFTPAAGVWSKFDEQVAPQKDQYHCRNRFWGFYLVNVPESPGLQRSTFSAEELEHSDKHRSQVCAAVSHDATPLFEALYAGTDIGSSFYSDFEHDYALSFKRFTYLIRKHGQPAFILSFSNYPDWASFNRGQDGQYLFPLAADISILPDEEPELFAVIREVIFRAGNTPYRVCIVSETLRLTVGSDWTNYLLRPEALEIAAKSLELS